MKYINAQDLLPDRLLKELQQYVSGEVIYIPKAESKKEWGATSGARSYYRQRNDEIREKHFRGDSLKELAEEYSLSVDSIRKIVD